MLRDISFDCISPAFSRLDTVLEMDFSANCDISSAPLATDVCFDRLDDWECPICFETSPTPKVLPCGHSVCQCCVQQLKTDAEQNASADFDCPVCRSLCPIASADLLPTNFALSWMIEQQNAKSESAVSDGKRFPCHTCKTLFRAEETWLCYDCELALFCSCCAMNAHRDHDVENGWSLLTQQLNIIREWKGSVSLMIADFSDI